LAAHYLSPVAVIVGTTFGMMLANVPAVLLGSQLANKLPLRLIRSIAAVILLTLGCLILLGVGQA
jgi:putative Ca2+/H+ antiporter (TMEM165/GDT1 family)